MSQTPSALRERLRAETAAQHQQVESDVRLLAPDVRLADYQHYLEQMWGFIEPFELALRQTPGFGALAEGLGLELERRRKAPLLREDLRALGDSPEVLERLPRCAALPALGGAAQA